MIFRILSVKPLHFGRRPRPAVIRDKYMLFRFSVIEHK